jgi:hypothetical protein
VRFVQAAQGPPVLALRGKNDASKIVQFCAFFCKTPGRAGKTDYESTTKI